MQILFYCLLLQHGCNAQTLYTDTVMFNKEYLSLKLTTNGKWINITWFSCSPARKYYYTLEVINRNIEMSYLLLRNLKCSIWNHFLLPVGTFPTERIHFQDKQHFISQADKPSTTWMRNRVKGTVFKSLNLPFSHRT